MKSPIKGSSGLGESRRDSVRVRTTDNTPADLMQIPVNPGEAVRVRVEVLARSTVHEVMCWTISALFYRIGSGNVTREDYDQVESGQQTATSSATASLEADTTTQKADLRVTGETGKTIDWEATATISRVVNP
jgi:hypothetical protein